MSITLSWISRIWNFKGLISEPSSLNIFGFTVEYQTTLIILFADLWILKFSKEKKKKKEKETFNRHLRKYRSHDGTTNPANNRKFETRAKLCLLRKNCFVSRVCTVKGFLTDWIPHRLFEWSIDNQYIGEGVAPIRPLLTVTTMSTNLRETSRGNSRFSGFFFPPFFLSQLKR